MIKAYSAEQIRAAEAPHLALGEPLMARAAAGLAAAIREVAAQRVLLLVGSGNNGADALWAGAELARDGLAVAIVATSDHPDAAALDAARNAGAQVRDPSLAAALATEVDVIVDGILGIGRTSDRALRGVARQVVAAIMAVPVAPCTLAVDIPSGIDPDDGGVPDQTVLRASRTVTFGGYKAGLFLEPAKAYAGDVRLVEVGIEGDLENMTPMLSLS